MVTPRWTLSASIVLLVLLVVVVLRGTLITIITAATSTILGIIPGSSSFFPPAALDHLIPNLGEVQCHDCIAGRLLVVESHKGVTFVFEVAHLHDPSELAKRAPQRIFIATCTTTRIYRTIGWTRLREHLVIV